jgi:hypothetical protein
VLAGTGVLAGVGVLAGGGAPTFGVVGIGLELPPPQAVTRVAAMVIAAIRRNADVIFVVLSKGMKPTLECIDEKNVSVIWCRLQITFMKSMPKSLSVLHAISRI